MSRSAAWLALALGLLISSLVTSLPGVALRWAHHAVTSEAPDDPGQLIALSRYDEVLRLADQRRKAVGRAGLPPAWRRAEALAHAAAGDVAPLVNWIEERSPWASEREIQALLVRGFDALEYRLEHTSQELLIAEHQALAQQAGSERPWLELADAARRARSLHPGLDQWITLRCHRLGQLSRWQRGDLPLLSGGCSGYIGCTPHRAGTLADAATSP